MSRERKVTLSNAERSRKYRAANPAKVLLMYARKSIQLKKRKTWDVKFCETLREKERIRKQKHRLATKSRALQQV